MNAVVSILGKKALGNLKKNNVDTNSQNPYRERVPVYDRNGRLVKHEERERPIPDGLSQNDRRILKKVRRKAYRWDLGFRLCCFNFRFGWSAIIGLLPFIGDGLDLMMAYSVVRAASQVDGGLPPMLRAKMMANILLDFAIGFVPVIGDLADAMFRANTRNAWLLDAYLTEKAKALREGQVQDSDHGTSHSVPVGDLRRDVDDANAPARPAQAHTVAGAAGARTRLPDEEMGLTTNAPARRAR